MWTSCGKRVGIMNSQQVHKSGRLFFTEEFFANHQTSLVFTCLLEIFNSLLLGVN